jgi:hypothetical protein
MEINKICFYNIGFSDKISDDYFDFLGRGVVILYGDDSCVSIKYLEDQKIDINKVDYDWWEEASKFIVKENHYNKDKEFISSLLQCADEENEDSFYEYIKENPNYKVMFENPKKETENIGYYCIKQTSEEFYEFNNNNLYYNKKKLKLEDLAGLVNDLDLLMVYLKDKTI